ncbi:MAG: SDR family oxidoreductase [Chloroflexota bacterium]
MCAALAAGGDTFSIRGISKRMTTTAGSSRPVAAVTGASRGIGRATAWELGRRGYRVIALARSESDLRDLVDAARADDLDIVPVVMDIAGPESRRRAVDSVFAATGGYGVDVLVNNAGYGQLGPMEEISVEQLEYQFAVNLFGVHAFTVPFLPGMRARRRGWIVNVSSIAGRFSSPFLGAYSASKFALEGMSDALRLELAAWNVRVVLIEPGPIHTGFGDAAQATEHSSPDSPYHSFQKRFRGAKQGSNLFQRSPESVARVIARAVSSDRPRPRYTVTLPAKAGTFAHRLVPDVLSDWVLRRAVGLKEAAFDHLS